MDEIQTIAPDKPLTEWGKRTDSNVIAQAISLAQGLGVEAAAKQMGIPVPTVSRWVSGDRMGTRNVAEASERSELVTQKRKEMTSAFIDIATAAQRRAMEVIPDTKDLKALVLAAAISTDKALLLSGGATSRSEHVVRFVGADSLRQLAQGDVIEGEVTEVEETKG